MISDYIYENIMTELQRKNFRMDVAKGMTREALARKYPLSKRFIRHFINSKTKRNVYIVPVSLRGKHESYYENEMEYGTLNLKYKYNEELEKERPNSERTQTDKG